jgi:hypothetical protein
MTDHSKSGPNSGDEGDPLSATAMFFRTLDKQSEGKPSEPVRQPDPTPAEGFPFGEGERFAGSRKEDDKGEFTAIFGRGSSGQSAPISPNVARPAAESSPLGQPIVPEPESERKQHAGEFTRIFVKGAGAKPAVRSGEGASDAGGSRGKGFSSPGLSDAASADNSFSQIFKPVPNVPAGSSGPGAPESASMFRAEERLTGNPLDRGRSEPPLARPGYDPISPNQDPQSVTGFIQSLSSPASAAGKSRPAEDAAYRPDAPPPFQPIAKTSGSPEFEAGGVTQFIQRLAESAPPPAPHQEARPVAPPTEIDSGPGEYTRIISSLNRPLPSSAEVPAAPPTTATPASAFVPPAVPVRPAIPAVPAVPHIPAMPAAPAMASHAVPKPTVPPAMAAPHLPHLPAPPVIAAPKGKLEALVPMLLVVNTFLLVVILIVMVFLIKAR